MDRKGGMVVSSGLWGWKGGRREVFNGYIILIFQDRDVLKICLTSMTIVN